MKSVLYGIVFCSGLVLITCRCVAQEAGTNGDDANDIPVVKLKLPPAAEPRPALRHRLLPHFLDRRPGNAALMYNKVSLQLEERDTSELQEKLAKWLDLPLNELPQDEAERELEAFETVLEAVNLATRREHCDWQLPLRETNPIALQLPELSKCREMGRILALQARLQIARGEFEGALHTLQTGFALGTHVAEGPTLVNALVGMAICRMMSDQVREFIQQPNSPNLYWALTGLPRPLIDLRKAAEVEMNFLYLMFPELQDVGDESRSVAYWRGFVDRILKETNKEYGLKSPKLGFRPMFAALAIKGYPQARRALIREGRSPEEVDVMPVAEVIFRYSLQTYDELRDETFKGFSLPYSEAAAVMKRAEHYFETEGRKREILPVASLLLPAVGAAKFVEARTDRDIALLRTIEALRMHVAGSEGKLPAALSEVTEVPVPLDPVTGKLFIYRLDGNRAELQAPAPPERPQTQYAKHFEIEVVQ
jgi:hypothetical protein